MTPPSGSDGTVSLLVLHHSPGTSVPTMVRAACEGAARDGLEQVTVRRVAALEVTAADVVAADGYLLATPANLGYMSGALKHAFDTVYNDALDVTAGRPFGVLVHGESDTTGALLGIEKITTGLRWRRAGEPVSVIGAVDDVALDACAELGAVVAATTLGY
ncbi:MAG: NAD(P)H-dependent oxidoreductase [Actinomycetota bacterium]